MRSTLSYPMILTSGEFYSKFGDIPIINKRGHLASRNYPGCRYSDIEGAPETDEEATKVLTIKICVGTSL